jgi:hypothetical protein
VEIDFWKEVIERNPVHHELKLMVIEGEYGI